MTTPVVDYHLAEFGFGLAVPADWERQQVQGGGEIFRATAPEARPFVVVSKHLIRTATAEEWMAPLVQQWRSRDRPVEITSAKLGDRAALRFDVRYPHPNTDELLQVRIYAIARNPAGVRLSFGWLAGEPEHPAIERITASFSA